LTEGDDWVVWTTNRDVKLWNFLTGDTTSVGDSGGDGVEDVVKTRVTTRWTRSWKTWLSRRIGAACWELIRNGVLWVHRRAGKSAGVEVWVDVKWYLVEASRELVVTGVVADSAVSWCRWRLTSGGDVSWGGGVDLDLDVAV